MRWHTRFSTQPEAIELLLALGSPAAVDARSETGGWSAREHLAHLARHAEVFRSRLERILREEKPAVGRYRAEEDPEWPAWSALPWEEALAAWREARSRLTAYAASLTQEELRRTGLHPVFGELTVVQWLEFFLLHEAHHLYTALVRLGEARRR